VVPGEPDAAALGEMCTVGDDHTLGCGLGLLDAAGQGWRESGRHAAA
jgi:hypothetical protein